MDRMGRKPFTATLLKRRAVNLSKQYPNYHPTIVEAYAENTGLK